MVIRTSGAALAAGLVLAAAGEARAADIALKSAEPYVKQCPAAGSASYGGFWQVPGTDTCISLGGYVWAEGYYNSWTGMPSNYSKLYSIATYGLQMDARTSTDLGVLRSFIDVRFQYRSIDEWGEPVTGSRIQVNPQSIYVQFGGFLVGYNQSMFDFYANENVQGTDPATIGDDTNLPMIAYTWELAHGWKATVSLEDGNERNSGANMANAASVLSPGWKSDLPDIVGAFGQSGSWGQFQISGALHRESVYVAGSAPRPWALDQGFWGYAVQAGVMFNLPQIASGDTLYLQTAYVNGAVSYLGLINASGDFSPPDAFLNPDGSLSHVSGWNVTGQYLHNFSSTWNASVFGGYARFDLNSITAEKTLGASGGTNYNVGGNVTWQPDAAFSLTLQYGYNMYKANNYRKTTYGMPQASQDASQVLLIAQRNF